MSKISSNTTTINNFKCPACGGTVEFNTATGNMVCPYCDTSYTIEAAKEIAQETTTDNTDIQWENYSSTSGNGDWEEGEKEQIYRYICRSCAGEIITDAITIADKCPYCSSPVVYTTQVGEGFRPDLVIPFQLDKEAAKAALTKHFDGKKLLPKFFKEEQYIDEIKGVYLPFWLFDCTADGNANFSATKVRHWSDSRYNYTETKYYKIVRSGSMDFIKVPADGSKKMDDDLMEAIEPFDYTKAVDFQTAYLSGFLAEKYDVESKDCVGRIDQRIANTLEQKFLSTISHSYSSRVATSKHIVGKNPKIQYALLPVWVLHTKYKDENYIYAMNGQTGKFVGKLPIDRLKACKYFFATFGISLLVLGILAKIIGFI